MLQQGSAGTGPRSGETVAEAVRRALLDLILFGDLAAPSRLFPAELAARFGVSITPVREALARLASEGFIEAIPRHGYHVRSPTPDHVTELWEVRLALELMAAEALLRRFPSRAARRAALAPLLALHRDLAGPGARSHRRHVALNGQFHDTLVELSGNALLSATYQAIRVRLSVAWVQRGSRAWRARLPQERAEHQAVLDALDDGNGAALDAALRRHLSRSLADALADVRSSTKQTTWQNEDREDDNEEAGLHDPGSGRRAAAAGARSVRARNRTERGAGGDDPDVDVPEPRRHVPARGRAR